MTTKNGESIKKVLIERYGYTTQTMTARYDELYVLHRPEVYQWLKNNVEYPDLNVKTFQSIHDSEWLGRQGIEVHFGNDHHMRIPRIKKTMTLRDVCSKKIVDPITNLKRDRYIDELIYLTDQQKQDAYNYLTYRCGQNTKQKIGRWIKWPQDYPAVQEALGVWCDRIVWDGEHGFMVVWGQDCISEKQEICRTIVKAMP